MSIQTRKFSIVIFISKSSCLPIASKLASFLSSVDVGLTTFSTKMGMRPFHWPTASSATATYATHWAAELGLLFSVPIAAKI